MYFDYEVKIPDSRHGITRKKIRGITYIYYAYDHKYSSDKHYTIPKNTTIGKCLDVSSETMYPNTNFLKYFPDAEIPVTQVKSDRSACLRIGAFIVIRKIIAEYHLDEMIGRLIGKDAGLFLDLAAYSIVTENDAGQYYPDYAYNHPLFTQGMKLYSDSKVSSFINSITRDQSIAFQNEWNSRRDHREKIYISYDSTNKNCLAGDLECVEIGHPKDDNGKPVLNYSIAYDHNNSEPLYYEEYPGSIVDVSQLQQMLLKAKGYGYRQSGFILDRGYFSKENIHFMDKNGYEFIIMMKGMKSLVRDLVLSVKGSFEEKREYSLRDYKVNGITVKHQLYPSDEKERYFHIYYNERKQTAERENVVANGFSNYEEYTKANGAMSKGRAVAETISETLIDMGKGAALTAGVAAPVVVVAGGAVVLSLGIDYVGKAITGDKSFSLTEKLSDAILDTGTAALKGAGKWLSDIGKQVSGAASKSKGVVCGWKSKVSWSFA